jgi:arabinose-5-phosphate isomerase
LKSVQDWLSSARAVMRSEAESISLAAGRLDGAFERAVELILQHPGKVLVSGMGKSGRIGEKIASTLASTGTPAVFLHPADAVHGDLGVYAPGDPTIVLSKSGSTAELQRLASILRGFGSPLIGILGNTGSPLAAAMDLVIDASVRCEADPHNLAPTASTAVALALGDALAVTLMQARRFTPEDFAAFHPGGQLGRNLNLCVREVMHGPEQCALVRPADALRQVLIEMTRHPLGAACVVDEQGALAGLITDGDLRRVFQAHDEIRGLTAGQVMTRKPVRVAPDSRVHDALRLMEDRPSQISVLPVVDPESGRCLGLVRLHDVYHAASR